MKEPKKKRTSSSIYKGVNLNKRSGLYEASVTHKGKRTQLGGFKTEKQAVIIRDSYILKNSLEIPTQVLTKQIVTQD
jgi:hypothetical protein